MQTLDTLGAGFQLASHDLDIRGAGNLLGDEQSGHIREVGIELYQHLLEEAVAAAKTAGGGDGEAAEEWSPQITIGTPVLIPESYVADLGVRLGLYRRIAQLGGPARERGFRRRADRPLRQAAGRGREPLADHRDQAAAAARPASNASRPAPRARSSPCAATASPTRPASSS